MEILEFLMSNMFFILLILGAISGIFGKKKQGEPETPRNRQRTPQQPEQSEGQPLEDRNPQPAQSPSVPWETVEQDARTDRQASYSGNDIDMLDAEEMIVKHEREQRESFKQQYSLPKEHNRTQNDPKLQNQIADMIGGQTQEIEPVHYSEKAKKLMDFKHMNAQNVTQGIIWSQILGHPRAKEPHRTNVRARMGRRPS